MKLIPRTSAAISPTALYTGYVWSRHGLSAPGFATPVGRALFEALRPGLAAGRILGGPALEDVLLARHRVIDHLLREEIRAGRVGQVIEVAAGLSPRGWRFVQEFEDLIYVEADLPGMATRKRALLHSLDGTPDATLGDIQGGRHRVVDLDALAEGGPTSLSSIAAPLDPTVGVAVITEGLLNYFPRSDVEGIWARFARVLNGFAHGVYLSDLHLASDNDDVVTANAKRLLEVFVRGRVHFHFETAQDAEAALRSAGFSEASLLRTRRFADLLPGVAKNGTEAVSVIRAVR